MRGRWSYVRRPGIFPVRVAGPPRKTNAAGRPLPAARAHLRRLLAEPVQAELVPRAGGQPASRAAWESDVVNAASGGFYQQTRATLDQAWVRPRFCGWIAFQDEGSAIVRDGLRRGASHLKTLRRLQAAFRGRCIVGRTAAAVR